MYDTYYLISCIVRTHGNPLSMVEDGISGFFVSTEGHVDGDIAPIGLSGLVQLHDSHCDHQRLGSALG